MKNMVFSLKFLFLHWRLFSLKSWISMWITWENEWRKLCSFLGYVINRILKTCRFITKFIELLHKIICSHRGLHNILLFNSFNKYTHFDILFVLKNTYNFTCLLYTSIRTRYPDTGHAYNITHRLSTIAISRDYHLWLLHLLYNIPIFRLPVLFTEIFFLVISLVLNMNMKKSSHGLDLIFIRLFTGFSIRGSCQPNLPLEISFWPVENVTIGFLF